MDYLISDTTLDNIATAIREKTGKQDKMTPVQMPDEIRGIPGGGEPEPPDDGKTRLYITVPANSMPDRPPPRNEVPIRIKQNIGGGVSIDWGDGTPSETVSSAGSVSAEHTYEKSGNYVITLDPVEGCELITGNDNSNYCVMGFQSTSNYIYANMLRRVSFGITGVKSIGSYSFQNCYSISSVKMPNGLSSIGVGSFKNCYSISSIIIPPSVNSIGDSAFLSCYGVKEYHLLPTKPPSLANKNAFNGIPSDCIIYVPVGSLEAYQTATNWSTYADQMQEEPA